jgi:hypothetical protein
MHNAHYIPTVPDYLGEFEHLILLALARLGDEGLDEGVPGVRQ